MKMEKKSLLMASVCMLLIMAIPKADADDRIQYSAQDANALATSGNTNRLSFTFSHAGRKGNVLTAKDAYSAEERHNIPVDQDENSNEEQDSNDQIASNSNEPEPHGNEPEPHGQDEIQSLSDEAVAFLSALTGDIDIDRNLYMRISDPNPTDYALEILPDAAAAAVGEDVITECSLDAVDIDLVNLQGQVANDQYFSSSNSATVTFVRNADGETLSVLSWNENTQSWDSLWFDQAIIDSIFH